MLNGNINQKFTQQKLKTNLYVGHSKSNETVFAKIA